jgi:hypothetical protein
VNKASQFQSCGSLKHVKTAHCHDFCSKLMTTGGACMRLQKNEVVDSVKVLAETHFSAQMLCIKSIDGDSRLVDSSEVVSQVCTFIDQEIAKKRKRYSRMPSWRTSTLRTVIQLSRRRPHEEGYCAGDSAKGGSKINTKAERPSRLQEAWRALSQSNG